MTWNGDPATRRRRMVIAALVLLAVGSVGILVWKAELLFPNKGTIESVGFTNSEVRPERQTVAVVRLADGRLILADMPGSAGACGKGKAVTLLRDGLRTVIAPNSCRIN